MPIRTFLNISLSVFAGFLWLAPVTGVQAQGKNTDVMLVLDASGSMWGRIGDKTKIEIARDVVGGLVGKWDANTNLGLIAYGHRKKGDCGDIETILPVGKVNKQSFVDRVNGLSPKGKTPLTEAVKRAAEHLKYTERAATVILVSDGIESCEADPCDLANILEKTGVDFTAHVVGFGIEDKKDQEKLACIAKNTGGRYINAKSPAELKDALETATKSQPEPVKKATITVEARDKPNGSIITGGLTWTLTTADGKTTIVDQKSAAKLKLELEAGDYAVTVTDGKNTAEHGFQAVAGVTDTHVVILTQQEEASVTPPGEAAAGSKFKAEWTGPNYDGDYITIVPKDAKDGVWQSYAYTKKGSPVTLTAPDDPGAYEVRYVRAWKRKVLARADIMVTPVQGSVKAPADVVAGAKFEVEWTGPNNDRDYITIVEKGANPNKYRSWKYTRGGSPSTLVAPETAGDYEVRYITGRSRMVLASQAITVRAAEASVTAPDSVMAGAPLVVEWTGPGNDRDYVTIAPKGAPDNKYLSWKYTNKPGPKTLVAPEEPGEYEVRYLAGRKKIVLARRALTVMAAEASISGAPEAVAGSVVEITWTGPNNKRDFVTIAPKGSPGSKYLNWKYAAKGGPVKLALPEDPGDYEYRYVTRKKKVLARMPVKVTRATASLEANDTAPPGSTVEVTWTGPANPRDYITIVKKGAPDKAYMHYRYANGPNPVRIKTPKEPGEYELRYVTAKRKYVLARKALMVE